MLKNLSFQGSSLKERGAENEAAYQQYQENKEDDLSNCCRPGSNVCESEYRGDNSDNEEDGCPF